MTIERNVVVGLEDIQAVRIRCLNCGSSISVKEISASAFPHRCPACNTQLLPPHESESSSLSRFMRALAELRDPSKHGGPFQVGFEFNDSTTEV